jgi:large subunit ribosomal protein L17
LGRTTAHRKALFRNQLTALFTHDRIITTLAKAKELRPVAERMVTLAGTGTLPARRKVMTMVPDKEVVRRLFDEIAPRFTDRPGGYTRVMRLGRRRGDGAELAIIEFVDYELSEHEEGGTPGSGKPSLMDRAKGVFGGGAAKDADEVEEEAMAAEEEGEESAEAAADEAEAEVQAEPAADDAADAEDEPEITPEAAPEEEPAEEPETKAEEVAEEATDEPESEAEAAEAEEEKKND